MKPEIKLMEHQQKAVEFARTTDHLALFFQMGTGKTAATIAIIEEKFQLHNEVINTVIFGPLMVVKQWKEEFEKFSDIDQGCIWALSKSSTRKKELKDIIEKKKKGIIILNYEAMTSKEIVALLHKFKPEIMVLDESHKVKSHNTVRSMEVDNLARYTKYRYLLTGTPILKDARDLFQQFKILDRGETFGKNFYVFQSMYFEDSNARWSHQPNHFPNYVIRPGIIDMMNEKIYKKAMRVKQEDCLDLPDLVVQNVKTEMSTEQKRLYTQMKKDFITFIQSPTTNLNDAIVAEQAMTKALRLQQIVTGFVKTDKGEEIPLKDNPRMKVLRELLETITVDSKVIVWACFRENYRQLEILFKEMGLNYVSIVGGMNEKDRDQARIDFQADPQIKVCLANQASGGTGVNLTSASYSIFFSRNFSYGDDEQAQARNYRKGSEVHQKVTRINIICEDSIDQIIHEALEKKQSIANLILALKEKL